MAPTDENEPADLSFGEIGKREAVRQLVKDEQGVVKVRLGRQKSLTSCSVLNGRLDEFIPSSSTLPRFAPLLEACIGDELVRRDIERITG